jgi:hypothetical protein
VRLALLPPAPQLRDILKTVDFILQHLEAIGREEAEKEITIRLQLGIA